MSEVLLQNPTDFFSALEDLRQPISCQGKVWKVSNVPSSRMVHKIASKKKENDLLLSKFLNVLSEIESLKLYFNESPEVMQKQTAFYQSILRAGRSIVHMHSKSKNDDIQKLSASLKLALIRLQYRIQVENGGLRKLEAHEVDENLFLELQQKVDSWKGNDEKYRFTQVQEYASRIRQICQYPEIAKFLLNPKNNSSSHEFFQRSLRDGLSVDAVAQYNECKKLADNLMANRIGAIGRELLTVDMIPVLGSGAFEKTLNLLMENRKVNILDKTQKVLFSNGSVWTIAEIYKDFKGKFNPGKLEIMWNGVIPFNGHELAPELVQEVSQKKFTPFPKKHEYVRIDTSNPRWFEQTPILDIRSKDYIKRRYNIDLEPGQWGVVFEATRIRPLDALQAHGYSLFFQPIGNDNYRVYSFGAFPWVFPQNAREMADFIGDTVDATVAFDPNYYYAQSQKASWPKAVSEEIALALLKALGLARKEGIAFQFAWENCAFFMRNLFNRVFREMHVDLEVPNFFKKKFLKMKPTGPLLVIQNLFLKVPQKLLNDLKVFLARIFRAHRSKIVKENGIIVEKSLVKTPFFKELIINAPSAMHDRLIKQHEAKLINPDHPEKYPGCVLNYGHMDIKTNYTEGGVRATAAVRTTTIAETLPHAASAA